MAYSDVQTAMTAATAALQSGDYATALTQAIAAQGHMAVLPDGGLASATGGAHTMEWDDKKIENFIANIRRRRGANAGIQRTLVTKVRPTT